MRGAAHRGASRARSKDIKDRQELRRVKEFLARIVPMGRAEASNVEGYQEPPQQKDRLKRFREESRNRMFDLGKLAVAARAAGETEEVQRYEVKVSIIKAALGHSLPTAQQLAEMRAKKAKCQERVQSTRHRMNKLQEEEAEQLDELDKIKDLISDLEDQINEEDDDQMGGAAPGGPPGGGPGPAAQHGGVRAPRPQPGQPHAPQQGAPYVDFGSQMGMEDIKTCLGGMMQKLAQQDEMMRALITGAQQHHQQQHQMPAPPPPPLWAPGTAAPPQPMQAAPMFGAAAAATAATSPFAPSAAQVAAAQAAAVSSAQVMAAQMAAAMAAAVPGSSPGSPIPTEQPSPKTPVGGAPTPVASPMKVEIPEKEEETPPLSRMEPISPTQPFRTGLTQEDPLLQPPEFAEKLESTTGDSPPRKEARRAEDCATASRGK